MEFKEYTNPEERDYDINMSFKNTNNKENKQNRIHEENKQNRIHEENKQNRIHEEFFELLSYLGFPEVHELEEYGITEEEYTNPTLSTIKKLKDYALDLKYNRKIR